MAPTWRARAIRLLAVPVVASLLLLPHAGAAPGSSTPSGSGVDGLRTQLARARSDQVKLAKLLQDAENALNRTERELQAAALERLAAQARARQAEQALAQAATRAAVLRRVLSQRARASYISGSPVDLAALVQNGNVATLLNQMAVLDHLAGEGNDSLDDLRATQRAVVAARADLLAAERDARTAEQTIRAKLAQAQAAVDLRTKAKEALDRRIGQLEGQQAVAALTAAQAGQRTAGVVHGRGRCSSSTATAAEDWIITRESGWDPMAQNPSSTAFGLGQLLLNLRLRLLGSNYATTDCAAQLYAFRQYVKERYGTAEAAKAFWQAHGWY